MIDLAPCIGIYQQANFFDYYDIDSAIAYYMYMHKDKKMAMPQSWKSVEQKVLFLTMLMTSQDRYVKQVELPIITREPNQQAPVCSVLTGRKCTGTLRIKRFRG